MSALRITLLFFFFALSVHIIYAEEKEKIPKEDKWERTDDRDISSPQLYQGDSSVYVYSEKQLDNVTECILSHLTPQIDCKSFCNFI